MFENPINKLRFWCHKIIPLVYDEALSYYEVICKVAHKINEVIDDVNTLNATAVFKVNDREPVDGNVSLEASDFEGAFVGSVNGVTPNESGELTLTASDVGAIASTTRVVKSINGFNPDENGAINAGTVRSVNGKSPTSLPTPGSITLNATDVGALPNSIDPVESVNGIAPDAQGNVNVGTVKSVNSTMPDSNGNVNLPTVAGVTSVDGIGADAQGNVQINAVKSVNGETPNAQGAVTIDVGEVDTVNNVNPTNGNITISDATNVTSVTHTDASDFNQSNIDTSKPHIIREYTWKNVVKIDFEFTTLVQLEYNSVILANGITLPRETAAIPFLLYGSDGNWYKFQIKTDGILYAAGTVPASIKLNGYAILLKYGSSNSITVT